MKIKFKPLDYQNTAVESIVSLFKGQGVSNSSFEVASNDSFGTLFAEDGIGIANNLTISHEELLKNLQKVQIKNQLAPSDTLTGTNQHFPQFNIEMETGTGKTFVYLKSIYDLNAKYGFKKFIIVVPSVAIKEGVIKTFNSTLNYFQKSYNNPIVNLFMFNGQKINQVRNFATSNAIEILVTTIQAFNKESNLMNKPNDYLNGAKPIDLIAETNPVLIIDEPQSVDNTEIAINAINSLNPTVGFRFSATHKNTSYPKIFKLDAVEAYEKELVKQIEVSSLVINENGNNAYIKLLQTKSSKTKISAQVEVYKKAKVGATKKTITLQSGDDLFSKTGLQIYEDFGFVQDIDTTKGSEAIYFSGTPDCITLASSNEEDLLIKRGQIAKTIEEHLNKELYFKNKSIEVKVLSLFFLDKVSNYRLYEEDGQAIPGNYAKIFEEEYQKLIRLPKYKILNDSHIPASEVHDGYFSSDGKGKLKDTNGSTQSDETTYEMIMQNKEGLLTFYNEEKNNISKANKIRFIFSHSALKEGWDNPNIFQIATLVETTDTITKRQKIGRGLRIAVDQNGNRIPGFKVNKLTVIANESYEEFAKGLQTEYEEDGLKFGYLSSDAFSTISDDESTNEFHILGNDKSEIIYNFLMENNFIDSKGKATPELKSAITNNNLQLPEGFEKFETEIINNLRNITKTIPLKKAEDKVLVKVNPDSITEEFLNLWDKIKFKSSYHVNFDTERFLQDVVDGNNFLDGLNSIQTRKLDFQYVKSTIDISDSGVGTEVVAQRNLGSQGMKQYDIPDIITYLQNKTNLTRKTIVKLLTSVDNLDNFSNNPISYMDQAVQLINAHKEQLVVNSLTYSKSQEFYDHELFFNEETFAYLGENGNSYKVNSEKNKTIFDYVVTDSDVEKNFAKELDLNEEVSFFIKLPDWFKIRTPLGPYNPDWAIVYNENNAQKLYFIIETKGNINSDQLRPHERAKILAGEKHFVALDTGIIFKKATKFKDIL